MKFTLDLNLDSHDQPLSLIVGSLRDIASTIQSQALLFAQTRAVADHRGKEVGTWAIAEQRPVMALNHTNRGFATLEFRDRNGEACSLQESSLATEECVWLGCDEIGLKRFDPERGWQDVPLAQEGPGRVGHIANNRMHLNRSQVRDLLPFLEAFAATGELEPLNEKPMALNERETSTILCGLRRLQDPLHGNRACAHSDDGMLDDAEIDDLAKRLDGYDVSNPPTKQPDASEPVHVVVMIEQGLVAEILADQQNVEVLVLDYDDESVDPSELHDVPQGDGTTEKAYCTEEDISVMPGRVKEIYIAVAG